MNDITFLPFKLQPADIKQLANTTDEVENDIVCKVWNLIEYADR